MMHVRLLGDQGLLFELDGEGTRQHHEQLVYLCEMLERQRPPGIVEWIPGFAGVAVVYDPLRTSAKAVERWMRRQAAKWRPDKEQVARRVVEIPVAYGGEWGPDLADVARLNHLSEDEVIRIHTAPTYWVQMIGFVPGFAYLGGMSARIATPRLATPRPRIEAGAVGIAGRQTGIYPLATPGGWRIIGRTPLTLFQPNSAAPSLLKMGDYLRFRPCGPEEFCALQEASQAGIPPVKVSWEHGGGMSGEGKH
ncbi:5-oxoprolinase subunit PxpB [Laceyella sacchari]|uniref:5-oxoprolinase subunit PxpB n=1 Tax=Laceyella sacchari TaxID=37482 RepID=A0ABY5U433_LACSH|nr:5-oxoprolinase subunit PxpB [Laceyella sacchari]UWE03934.1 5-oxoprolinase subunit PxpB [Laceyella sacchari]